MERILSASTKTKVLMVAAIALLVLLIPVSASALTAKFRSLNGGTGAVSCAEAKQSVNHAWGYTVNSGTCQQINSGHERIWTPSYRYDVSKDYERPWWDPTGPGSYYTTVQRTAR